MRKFRVELTYKEPAAFCSAVYFVRTEKLKNEKKMMLSCSRSIRFLFKKEKRKCFRLSEVLLSTVRNRQLHRRLLVSAFIHGI
jgi:hypothetical protein